MHTRTMRAGSTEPAPMSRPGRLTAVAAILWLAGCGPGSGATEGGADGAGTTALEASSGVEASGDPDLPPDVAQCGNGVVEPGEACDDGHSGCDACTDQCTVLVEPEVEWGVALDSMVAVRGIDMTQGGRFYVLGETADGAFLLHTVELSGITHTVDFAALGLARIFAFHVNGAASDAAEVGVLGEDVDGSTMVARLGADGVLGEWLAIDRELVAEQIAVTSAGLTLLNYQDVWNVSLAGTVSGPFDSFLAHHVDALGDRLVFLGSSSVVLTDPDGGARVDVSCPASSLTTSGTHVVWSEGSLGDGELVMGSCELASGEASSAVIASGSGGLESGPFAYARDGAPNGNPIGTWSVCPLGAGSVGGCHGTREYGFGGPGDPRVLELDACDDGDTAIVAPDKALYMIRSDRETGALRLVRRWTLPDRPPWS